MENTIGLDVLVAFRTLFLPNEEANSSEQKQNLSRGEERTEPYATLLFIAVCAHMIPCKMTNTQSNAKCIMKEV